MSQSIVAVCPHCGNTGTFSIGISEGSKASGSSWGQCKMCHKSFKIEYRNGKIYRIIK